MKIKEKVMSQVLVGKTNPNTQKYALIRIAIEKTLEEVGKLIEEITYGCNKNLEEVEGSCGDISFSNNIMLCESCSPLYFKIQELKKELEIK